MAIHLMDVFWLVSPAQIESQQGSRLLSGVSTWAVAAIMFLAIFAIVVVVAGLLASSMRRNRMERSKTPRRAIPAGTPIEAPTPDAWREAGRRAATPSAEDLSDPGGEDPRRNRGSDD